MSEIPLPELSDADAVLFFCDDDESQVIEMMLKRLRYVEATLFKATRRLAKLEAPKDQPAADVGDPIQIGGNTKMCEKCYGFHDGNISCAEAQKPDAPAHCYRCEKPV